MGISDWSSDVCCSVLFGAVLEGMLGSIKKYELWVLGALLILGVGLWLRRRFKNARLAKQVYAAEQAAKAALLNQAEVAKPADPKTPRTEERRKGKERVSTCRSRGTPYH